jgi:hypothetical protein
MTAPTPPTEATRPSAGVVMMRALVAALLAAGINVGLLYLANALFDLIPEIPVRLGSTDLAPLTWLTVVAVSAGAAIVAGLLLLLLNSTTGSAQKWFRVVILTALILSLTPIFFLEITWLQRAELMTMHLVVGVVILFLLTPLARQEAAV